MPSTPYADLVGLVKNYYEPKPSVIVQRYKFNTQVRQQGKSVATYVAALRELAKHCSYGTTLPEMFRDRLVCGINHEAIQRKLLAEKDLTYESSYQLAQSIETAERDSRHIKGAGSSTTASTEKPLNITKPAKPMKTHKTPDSANPPQGQIMCYRCGGPHLATKYKWKNVECRFVRKRAIWNVSVLQKLVHKTKRYQPITYRLQRRLTLPTICSLSSSKVGIL